MAADEPAAKKPKLDEDSKDSEPKKDAEEQDSPVDSRPTLKDEVCVHNRDCTLNVIPTLGGRILMPITDGGLQYLIGGVRASVGLKAGRYCFEIKIIEALNPTEPPVQRGTIRPPHPRQLVRIGFSTQSSPLFLGDEAGSICFDSEGFYSSQNTRSVQYGRDQSLAVQRFGRDQSIAIVLNLDARSPNANTVSLFRDGERISAPQHLPESLRGKVLFPTVNFKNVTLQVNWGPSLMTPLPFSCRMVQGAATEDSEAAPSPLVAKDGKYEVLFPVGLPDEGTFDWLDMFLEKHPQYTELSDRKIIEWARRSGLNRPTATGWKHCYDKPDMIFGLPLIDDRSIQRILTSIITTQPRNYVVAEVKANLVKAEREELVKKFTSPCYKKIAQVVMGEPTEEFKNRLREQRLAEKQDKLDAEWKQRLADVQKKREFDRATAAVAAAQRKRELAIAEAARKQAEEEAARKQAEEEESRRKTEEEEAKQKAEEEEARTKAAEEEAQDILRDVTGLLPTALEETPPPATDPVPEKKEEGEDKKDEEEGVVKKEQDAAKEPVKDEEPVKEELVKEEPVKEEPVKEEAKDEPVAAEVKMEVEVKEEEKEEEQVDEPRPVATLTEDERGLWFRKKAATDLASWTLSNSFAKFSVPDTEEEGFDEVRYEWAQGVASSEYLRQWILKSKITTRIEDLVAGEWFQKKWVEWQRAVQLWHAKQNQWQMEAAAALRESKRAALESAMLLGHGIGHGTGPVPPPPPPPAPPPPAEPVMSEGAEKAPDGTVETAGEEKKPEGEEVKKAEDGNEPQEGQKPEDEKMGEEKKAEEGQQKPVDEKKVESEEKAEDVNMSEETEKPEEVKAEIDIFTLEDVCNYKDGEPLFSKFEFEDWTLLSLRLEMYLLVHAFQKDANDPERAGIHEMHLLFYYNKYFRKSFNVKHYGVDSNVELAALIKDTITVKVSNQVLETPLGDEIANFDILVKLTEEARRERHSRIDGGDETAKLKFQPEISKGQPGAGGKGDKGKSYKGKNPQFGSAGKGFMPKGGLPAGFGFAPHQSAVGYAQPPAPGVYDGRKGCGGAQQYGGKGGYNAPPPPMPPVQGAYGPGGVPQNFDQRRGAPYPPPPVQGVQGGFGGFRRY